MKSIKGPQERAFYCWQGRPRLSCWWYTVLKQIAEVWNHDSVKRDAVQTLLCGGKRVLKTDFHGLIGNAAMRLKPKIHTNLLDAGCNSIHPASVNNDSTPILIKDALPSCGINQRWCRTVAFAKMRLNQMPYVLLFLMKNHAAVLMFLRVAVSKCRTKLPYSMPYWMNTWLPYKMPYWWQNSML